jgi:hypothetical protein
MRRTLQRCWQQRRQRKQPPEMRCAAVLAQSQLHVQPRQQQQHMLLMLMLQQTATLCTYVFCWQSRCSICCRFAAAAACMHFILLACMMPDGRL